MAVGMGARTAGIAWFLPESHVENIPASPPSPPQSNKASGGSRPQSGVRRRRRRRCAKDNDGVNVIDIEDEDHSFTSFFVGVGKNKSSAGAATGTGGTNSSSSSEASEVKRPMVLFGVGPLCIYIFGFQARGSGIWEPFGEQFLSNEFIDSRSLL